MFRSLKWVPRDYFQFQPLFLQVVQQLSVRPSSPLQRSGWTGDPTYRPQRHGPGQPIESDADAKENGENNHQNESRLCEWAESAAGSSAARRLNICRVSTEGNRLG